MEKEEFIHRVLPLRQNLVIYARRFLKNEFEVEDVIQEVFLKLWCIRDTLDRYDSVSALSHTMVKNLSLNRIKQMHRSYSDVDNISLISNAKNPDESLVEKDELKYVMHLVGKLPEMQQAILTMRHVEGLEVSEISELTGCNPEAIRVNLSRARKRIKENFVLQRGRKEDE